MRHNDGRQLSSEAQEERRRLAVDMKQDGATLAEICEVTGMNPTTVCRAWSAFQKGGYDALKGRRRGRREGEKRSLSEADEKKIRKKIVDKLPEQLKLDFALWTRDAVRRLIAQEIGIEMPIRTVGEYLKRWGFTPQKPVKFAYERRPEAVKKWLDVDYPEIRERANKEKAEIYWGDETGLRSNDVRGRGFAPKGKTPIIHVSSKREHLSMVSAITNKGKLHWMIVDGAVNQEIFLKFLKGLVKQSSRKIFLILDNLKVHHGKAISAWVENHEKRIELFFLPAYSPDLNPDEHLNADLKQGVGARAPSRSKKHLAKAAEDHLAMIKENPSRIREYFKDPAIAYAASHI
jgi:transposase